MVKSSVISVWSYTVSQDKTDNYLLATCIRSQQVPHVAVNSYTKHKHPCQWSMVNGHCYKHITYTCHTTYL